MIEFLNIITVNTATIGLLLLLPDEASLYPAWEVQDEWVLVFRGHHIENNRVGRRGVAEVVMYRRLVLSAPDASASRGGWC